MRLGIRASYSNAIPNGGGTPTPTPTPGLARPDFTSTGLTPAFLYHPQTETGVTTASGEVTNVTGLAGSPDMTRGTTGPLEVTDALGRKFWRFRGTDYLELPNTFTSTPRAITIVMVGRQHRNANACNFFGHSYQSDGVTLDGFNVPIFNSYGPSQHGTLRAGNVNSNTTAVGRTHMAPGCQMSVFGIASRTTANGGARFLMNEQAVNAAQTNVNYTGMKGARIGGYRALNGTQNYFDLYAMVAFAGELTNAQADAVAAKLVSDYGIVPYTKQIVIDGDSIHQGVSAVPAYASLGMVLTDPGSGLLPANVRVFNHAISGSAIADLVTRRDTANQWPVSLLPGGSPNNILLAQIGRNDFATKTGAQIYSDISAYLTTPTTGVLDRGFDVVWGVNITTSVTFATQQADLRAALRDPAFLALSPGRISRIDLPLITVAGETVFADVADAQDLTYYQNDQTHPSILGTQLMATGGDTPANGYGSVL